MPSRMISVKVDESSPVQSKIGCLVVTTYLIGGNPETGQISKVETDDLVKENSRGAVTRRAIVHPMKRNTIHGLLMGPHQQEEWKMAICDGAG